MPAATANARAKGNTDHAYAALSAEQRLASVVVVDLTRTSVMAFRDGAAAVNRLVADRHLLESEAQRANAVHVTAGGDGLVVVFDGPSEAVRFARALQKRVDRVNASGHRSLPLSVRIGVATGEVTQVRQLGNGESEILGFPVTVASHLSQLADDGQVLVDEATANLAGHARRSPVSGRLVRVPDLGQVSAYTLAS